MGFAPEELATLKGLVASAARKHNERVVLATDVLARLLRQFSAQQATIEDVHKAVCWRCHKMATSCACIRDLEGKLVAANDALIASKNRERALRDALEGTTENEYDETLAKYRALGYVLPVFTDDYCHYGSKQCEFSTCKGDTMYCSMSLQPLVRTADGYRRCSRCIQIMDGRRSHE